MAHGWWAAARGLRSPAARRGRGGGGGRGRARLLRPALLLGELRLGDPLLVLQALAARPGPSAPARPATSCARRPARAPRPRDRRPGRAPWPAPRPSSWRPLPPWPRPPPSPPRCACSFSSSSLTSREGRHRLRRSSWSAEAPWTAAGGGRPRPFRKKAPPAAAIKQHGGEAADERRLAAAFFSSLWKVKPAAASRAVAPSGGCAAAWPAPDPLDAAACAPLSEPAWPCASSRLGRRRHQRQRGARERAAGRLGRRSGDGHGAADAEPARSRSGRAPAAAAPAAAIAAAEGAAIGGRWRARSSRRR